ncbi:hypothetical protein C7S17_2703 [Burkholderia thailandensis]|nr:hypothetical protein [Burkholderia thailandensis]
MARAFGWLAVSRIAARGDAHEAAGQADGWRCHGESTGHCGSGARYAGSRSSPSRT